MNCVTKRGKVYCAVISVPQEHIFARKPEDLPFVSGAYEIFLNKHGISLPPFQSSDEKELMSTLAQTAKLACLTVL